MASTNRQRVEQALDELESALLPWFERLVTGRYGKSAWDAAVIASDRFGDARENFDLPRLANIFHEFRNELFRDAMGRSAVNHMHEAQDIRNRWAHKEQFSTPDTLRALDTIARLLEVVDAPQAHDRVLKSHEQLLRSLYTEQARSETRKRARTLNSKASDAMVPWREIAEPHEDVRIGQLKEAEFAADLDRVYQGTAGPEYQDPEEFFRRTYLTEGLTTLLTSAFNRLHGTGGDPVLELQTQFGGGKTHSMIALYHAASGVDPATLPGLEPLARQARVTEPLFVQRAVLVGTRLSPNEPRRKTANITTHTLWGELAWQLAQERGYELVASSDRSGLAPGAQVLQQLFDLAGPSLILIDEWVAYMRPLYHVGDSIPAAGSFEANLTFAQNLTEAVAGSEQVMLAASLPTSQIEVGGVGGDEALNVLRHTFSRVKASWRAASTDESFEIVRRRLFREISDHRKRDATIRMYREMYEKSPGLYPTKVNSGDYTRRMESAYPFHPETFDLLFEVWGSLDEFQRTRGVLRLMANVVHTLWNRQDASPLIMPAHIPLDAVGVVTEMGGYLPDSWSAVIEHDIDGEGALSLQIDRENGNFDRLSATRRVARTVFFGSAPTFRSDNKGIDDRTIRLGVVQPGENASIFGDALRTLANQATFLYSEHGRYWFSTQPSVTQMAQERIDQLPVTEIDHGIVDLLRAHQNQRGIFDRVHVAPATSGDVVDTAEASLVILGPDCPHVRNQHDPATGQVSPAVTQAANMVETRGDGRRLHRNGLVFLAGDQAKLVDLRRSMAQKIVWQDIVDKHEGLNLDPQQHRQARGRLEEAERTVSAQLRGTWQWLLAPYQDAEPGSPVQWDSHQLRSIGDDEPLPVAASKRAQDEECVVVDLAGTVLRLRIEEIPNIRDGWTHIPVRDLAGWFSQYLYLPRLRDTEVLRRAITQGASAMMWATEAFAYADSVDPKSGRYLGLTAGTAQQIVVTMTSDGVIVHPVAAQAQFETDISAEAHRPGTVDGQGATEYPAGDSGDEGGIKEALAATGTAGTTVDAPRQANPTRYFGTVTLNPQTVASQVREISQEIVSHLQSIYGAQVKLSLEIDVTVPDGIPEDRRRVVEENTKSLRFDQSEFAES